MTPYALKCRILRRDLASLIVLVAIAIVVTLFAEFESKWIFTTSAFAAGLINPLIRFVLLQCGVMRASERRTPKSIRQAEGLLILAHMFRVMFAGMAPVTVASVAIELTTSGSHGIAYVIASVLSGVGLWTAAIAVTCYMVKYSKRDLDRLCHENPPTM